jgi:2-polyprenyl-6-methoxyphenol hydroxylase-like FAD-dependent oxidoreductase
MFSSDRKVCIVGGGPVGLAAGIALRRDDYDVTVIDCAIPPVDKACGEGLMPDSLAALAQLGVEIPDGTGLPFRGIRFADRHSSVCADFPNGIGRGLRRTVLHEILIHQATRLGVSFLWGAKHVRLTQGGIAVDGDFIRGHLILGADGQNSQIRRQAALDGIRCEKRRYGFRRHYRVAPWSSYMELHWGARSQIYVTPIAEDEICVVVISRDPKLRLEEALSEFPELRQRLRSGEPISPEMGALSISRTLRSVQRGNVVLIGDASGSVDAITGEGMCLGFNQALALAQALKAGNIRQYQLQHRALMKHRQTMAALMLMLERNGGLQRRALAGLAQHPKVFESLLAVHVGASSFAGLRSWRLVDFGWAFLTA